MALGALFAVLDYEGVAHDEFNDWYDTEHIPERLSVPGFLNAERWLAADGRPLSVVTYDLQSPEVLASAPYRAITGENFSPWSKRMIGRAQRFWRYEAEQIFPGSQVSPEDAGGLLFLAMNVEPDAEEDFNRWNNTEHVPNIMSIPDVLAGRRYRSTVGEHRYIVVYHLRSPEVAHSDAWKRAIETPWTHRIRPRTRDRMRIVCRRYERVAIAS
jgi:hypothetical protein